MEPARKSRLEEIGIDVDSVLDRFMGNEGILTRFLKKFLDDANYEKLKDAVEKGDAEAALTASHTLKGVSGNLSMNRLYELTTRQVQLLGGKGSRGEGNDGRDHRDLSGPDPGDQRDPWRLKCD